MNTSFTDEFLNIDKTWVIWIQQQAKFARFVVDQHWHALTSLDLDNKIITFLKIVWRQNWARSLRLKCCLCFFIHETSIDIGWMLASHHLDYIVAGTCSNFPAFDFVGLPMFFLAIFGAIV